MRVCLSRFSYDIGNHEEGSSENWQSYFARYPSPYLGSGSTTEGYWGKEVGPVHVIGLNTYYGSSSTSHQYLWLQKYLATKVDRKKTPWLIVLQHAPTYSTNIGHWKEAELFRRSIEPLLYKYKVDVMLSGHIHSYERTFPVYNYTRVDDGITYFNLGDAGNYEGTYINTLIYTYANILYMLT